MNVADVAMVPATVSDAERSCVTAPGVTVPAVAIDAVAVSEALRSRTLNAVPAAVTVPVAVREAERERIPWPSELIAPTADSAADLEATRAPALAISAVALRALARSNVDQKTADAWIVAAASMEAERLNVDQKVPELAIPATAPIAEERESTP